MLSRTTEKIIDHLADIFCRPGLPNTIKSDNGPQFKSNEFREYCKQHSIIHQKVAAQLGPSQRRGRETESVTVEATTNCSGREQTSAESR